MLFKIFISPIAISGLFKKAIAAIPIKKTEIKPFKKDFKNIFFSSGSSGMIMVINYTLNLNYFLQVFVKGF